MEKNIEILIDKRKERTYFEVPFEVPENVCKMEVSYSYKRRDIHADELGNVCNSEINIIDIAIRDESMSFRGASGSERLYFYITENEATPGYIKGAIGKGNWAIILGAYKVQEEGCTVKINVKFTYKERVLLKGDTHVHSVHSDGKYDVENNINMAKLYNMDFLFLTDHNTFSQNEYAGSSDGLVVLPGMEWTHYEGHANFIGIEKPIKYFVSNDKETTISILNEARKNGATVILNHPFCRSCPWKWGFDVPFDAVEIWNGPIKDADYDAINWWHKRLTEGDIIPIVGGSDSHKNELFRMIGTPTTFLYSDSRGYSDIINAIKKGHSFISYTQNGPIIDFSIGSSILGDCISYRAGLKGKAVIQNLASGDKIKLISDKGDEALFEITNLNTKVLDFEVKKRLFYRIEVWREVIPKLPSLVSISNPIYIRE